MLKIGIAGVGHLGEIHLKNWLEFVSPENIAIYDSDETRLGEISARYAVKFFSNYDQLMSFSQIIDIVTPTDSHYVLAKKALMANKDVFIEKPVCESRSQLEDLIEIRRRLGNIVQIGFVERYNPAFTAIKEKIENPRFFEVHRLAPYNPRGTEVSVIMDLMIHDLDILSFFVKSKLTQISATGVPIISSSPDITNVRMEFECGCVANLTASRISMKRMRKMRVFSINNYANIDFLEKKSEQYCIMEDDSIQEGLPFQTKNGISKRLIHNEYNSQTINSMQEELTDFYDHVLTRNMNTMADLEGSQVSLEWAIKIQEILDHTR